MKMIKNVHLVQDVITEDDLKYLDQAAYQYARNAGVYLKFHYLKGKEVALEVKQINPAPGTSEIFEVRELVRIGKELMDEVLPEFTAHIRPVKYEAPVTDMVTPQWLQKQMSIHKVSGVSIARQTGIDSSNISNWLSGSRPMSQPVKAMFYFMFKNMDNE